MVLPDASPDQQDAAVNAQVDYLRRMHMRQLRLLWPDFRTYRNTNNQDNMEVDSETDSETEYSEQTSHSSEHDDGYATLSMSPGDSAATSSTPSVRDSLSSGSSLYPFSISSILGLSPKNSARSASSSSSVSSMSSIYHSSISSGSDSCSRLATNENSEVITSRKRRRGRPYGSCKFPRLSLLSQVELEHKLPCENPKMVRTFQYNDNEDYSIREKREKNRFAARACRVRTRQRQEDQLMEAKEQAEQVAYIRSVRPRLKMLSIRAQGLIQRLPMDHPDVQACLDEFDQIAVENAEFFGKYPAEAPFYKLD